MDFDDQGASIGCEGGCVLLLGIRWQEGSGGEELSAGAQYRSCSSDVKRLKTSRRPSGVQPGQSALPSADMELSDSRRLSRTKRRKPGHWPGIDARKATRVPSGEIRGAKNAMTPPGS